MEKRASDYNNLFDFNPIPSWVSDLSTFEIRDVNKAALAQYGYTKEAFLSLNILELHEKGEIARFKKAYQSIEHKEGNIFLGEYTHLRESGEKFRVEITCQKVDFQGRKCIVGVCRDITLLTQNRQEVHQIMDASLDVLCAMNEAGDFEYVSAASISHWGYTPEELLGKSYLDLILEEDLPKTLETIAALRRGEQIKAFVNRYRKKNGDIAYNSWSARWDEDTGIRYGVARDCKERIEQEEKIQQSEQRFKALVQEGSDLIAILDIKGNYLYVSATSTSILGVSPQEFKGRNIFDFIHPDDAAGFLESMEKITSENKLILQPYRFQNHLKEWRWMETVLTNMLDNPAVKGIVANSRDITKKIEEEQNLKLLESVITHTNDAVLITEAEPFEEPGNRFIYVNEAFTKLTGYEANEVIGKSPRFLQGPNSNKKKLAKMGLAIRKWEPYELTTINYKKSGEEFWINFAVTPVANEKGRYTHWVAIERDVTEQKTKELEKELIAQISLDFNNENDFPSAAKALCKSVSTFGKFDWVEVWTLNREKTRMQLVSHFVAQPKDEVFYEHSDTYVEFKKSISLVGHVWNEQAEVVWNDIEMTKDFKRFAEAKKIGLKSVMGIPLIYNNELTGVLNVGTKRDVTYLKNHSRIFQRLERFIGSEINRKKLEDDLGHLIGAIPDILCLIDFKSKFLKMNKSGCDLLGYNEEDILYHSFEEFVHPDDRSDFANVVAQLRKKETTFKFENRFISKSGEIVWLSWYCNAALNEGLIYATAKNITKEKGLRELNRQANSLAKIGSWELDVVNQSMFWSNEVHLIHDTDPDSFEVDLEIAIDFYRADFHEMVQSSFENAVSNGEPFDFEAVLVTAIQKERWVRCIGKPEIVNGKCVKIYGSFQVIHLQKTLALRIDEILGSISDAFYAVDKDWNFIYFNKEAERLLAHLGKDVLGKNLWSIFPLVIGTDLEEVYYRVAENNLPETFEYIYPADGEWYEISVYTSAGGLSVYFKNINERKKDAENLEKAYTEKNKILESIGDAFFALDNDWTVTYWNKESELLTGTSRADILGKNLWEVYPEAVDSDFYREYIKAKETLKVVRFIESYGDIKKWIEVSAYPSADGLLVYFKDVTLKKEADLRLHQANERFEKVTEATNDAIWDWDIVNQVYFRSKAIENFFGSDVSKSLTTAEFWKDKFHPSDLEKIRVSIDKAISDPKCMRWELEYRIFNENGNTVYVIDRGVIIRDAAGKAIRMVGAMTDITELKQMGLQLRDLNKSLEQYTLELERSNEELEQFAFVVSHDLQEPLRMISSFMDQLKRKYGDLLDEKAHQYIHFATDGAKRMKQIILDLLEYSRAINPTEGRAKVDMNQLLTEFKELRRKLISEKSATITSNKLPTLNTYKAALTQILHGILDNALKYSKAGTDAIIQITATEKNKEWEFAIQDNGIGIDPQFYDKIFIIFQRLHNKHEYGGTGIGLSVAKRHIEFLGGRIWLDAAPEGGTIFYFTTSKTK